MTSISLPLQVGSRGLTREEKLKKSLDASISLILSTPLFSTPADPQFGFVFNNLRFEMFNENEGVVFDSGDTDTMNNLQGLYVKSRRSSSRKAPAGCSSCRYRQNQKPHPRSH